MNELFTMIKKIQDGDVVNLIELCERFSPLIKKYSKLANYEDSYSELQLCFIECIYKIPLDSGKFSLSDAYILAYIKNSIYYAYIALSKATQKYEYINILDDNYEHNVDKTAFMDKHNMADNNLFLLDIKELLNGAEYELFVLKYIYCYSDIEIGKIYNISRQAVNKRINKIKEKLRLYFFNH